MRGSLDIENMAIEINAAQYEDPARAQVAWDLLQRAKQNLVGFERLSLWLRAAEVAIRTNLGDLEGAREECEAIAQQLQPYHDDTATLSVIWTYLAHTYVQLGDWKEAARWGQRYLDSPFIRPVYRADTLCELGACQHHLGNEQAARACWQQVLDLNIPIAATQRARDSLAGTTG